MKTKLALVCAGLFLMLSVFPANAKDILDSMGKTVVVPDHVSRIICSGPGALRLITYLNAQDLVVAVDDMETARNQFDARPYAIANPRYKTLPVFGEFRGNDDPEKILGLSTPPQVIFKTYAGMGYDPVELSQKTGIPVVVLGYSNLAAQRDVIYNSLRIIGRVLDREERAEALIGFFNNQIAELNQRTAAIENKKTCFVGGIAHKGPHGFLSTEPNYPPFEFVNAANIARTSEVKMQTLTQSTFSKEKLLEENPDVLFLDLSTLQMGEGHGGLYELKTDPVFQALDAVLNGRVYGVLPYNWYTQNFGSILADAWYVGKVLYPDQFADVDPAKKADEIYDFLLSANVYADMDALFRNTAFKPVDLGSK
ncbi:iron ABC transporter substrate-binding protein [Desulfobacter curvatus]|uniref:iron ABC transporter substrate-binding protein n=1 Tax=Desulfobacter curvatus TaxID=2290 RepID=UPI00036E99E1|nr:iron ABC transporter substrate-binding protein [Desulfobacter curvatus]